MKPATESDGSDWLRGAGGQRLSASVRFKKLC